MSANIARWDGNCNDVVGPQPAHMGIVSDRGSNHPMNMKVVSNNYIHLRVTAFFIALYRTCDDSLNA